MQILNCFPKILFCLLPYLILSYLILSYLILSYLILSYLILSYTEECRNPDQYLDYDICSDITVDDCADGDAELQHMLMEFCPEKCSCREFLDTDTQITSDLIRLDEVRLD